MSIFTTESASNAFTSLQLAAESLHLGPFWHRLCTEYGPCRVEQTGEQYPTIYPGFYDAPASVAAHHNYRHGLIEHYAEMWSIYQSWRATIFAQLPEGPIWDEREVFLAIVGHDIHKARFNYVASPVSDPQATLLRAVTNDGPSPRLVTFDIDSVTYTYDLNSYQYSSHVEYDGLTKTVRNINIMQGLGADLSVLVQNAICNAEGGYVAEKTKHTTPFAKMIYLLDEMSANVLNRSLRGRDFHYKEQIKPHQVEALQCTD